MFFTMHLVKTKTKPPSLLRNASIKQFLGQQGFNGEKKSCRGRQADGFFIRCIPTSDPPAELSYALFMAFSKCMHILHASLQCVNISTDIFNKNRLSKFKQIGHFRQFY